MAIVCRPSIPPEQARAVDQTLTEEERAEAREEADHSGKSAKYCLKEVRQSFFAIYSTRRRTDHDLDHLDPNLPFGGTSQDLHKYIFNPGNMPCGPCRFYGSHPATEAKHIRDLSALKGLLPDQKVGIDGLSEM